MSHYTGMNMEELSAELERLAAELRSTRMQRDGLRRSWDNSAELWKLDRVELEEKLKRALAIADMRGPHDTYEPSLVRRLCEVASEGETQGNEFDLQELSAQVLKSVKHEKAPPTPEEVKNNAPFTYTGSKYMLVRVEDARLLSSYLDELTNRDDPNNVAVLIERLQRDTGGHFEEIAIMLRDHGHESVRWIGRRLIRLIRRAW